MASLTGARVGWLLPGLVVAVAVVSVLVVGLLVSTAEADRPARPTGVVVEGGTRAVTVGFDVAASSAPRSFEVSVNDSQWLPLETSTAGDRVSGLVEGLLDGTTYGVRVRAVGRSGTSEPSAGTRASRATTAGDPPQVEVDAETGDGEVTLRFSGLDEEQQPPAGWRVRAEPVDTDDPTLRARQTVCDVAGAACTLRDLIEGEDYELVVTPVTSQLTGSLLVQTVGGDPIDLGRLSALAALPAPVDLAAVPLDGALRMTWSMPPQDAEQPVEGFEVAVGSGRRPRWTPVETTPGEQASWSATVTGLVNGESVEVSLRAVGGGGPGLAAEVEGAPAGTPGRVRDPVVVTRGTAVTLRWRAPRDDGGAAIRTYVVSGFDNPGCTTAETRCTIRDVDLSPASRFRISADNTTDDLPDTGLGPAVRTALVGVGR